jgi:hypothetical protein
MLFMTYVLKGFSEKDLSQRTRRELRGNRERRNAHRETELGNFFTNHESQITKDVRLSRGCAHFLQLGGGAPGLVRARVQTNYSAQFANG